MSRMSDKFLKGLLKGSFMNRFWKEKKKVRFQRKEKKNKVFELRERNEVSRKRNSIWLQRDNKRFRKHGKQVNFGGVESEG